MCIFPAYKFVRQIFFSDQQLSLEELALPLEVFAKIYLRWGTPDVDLFSSSDLRFNSKESRTRNPKACVQGVTFVTPVGPVLYISAFKTL